MLNKLVFLAIAITTFGAEATYCRVDSGEKIEIPNGNHAVLDVKVNINENQNASFIKLGGYKLECQFEWELPYGETDYVKTIEEGFILGPKFHDNMGGLIIHGAQYQTPIPENTWITDLPAAGGPPWKDIDTFAFVNLKGRPGESVEIKPGDLIGTIKMEQTNNYDSKVSWWDFRLIAQNSFIVRPSTCTINDGHNIDVDYGMVDINNIGQTPAISGYRKQISLTFKCPDPGVTMPIKIKFKGISSEFNADYLSMSNKNTAIAMEFNNRIIPIGEGFDSRIADSYGNDNVVFSLVRKSGSIPEAGPVVGSGVLEMTMP